MKMDIFHLMRRFLSVLDSRHRLYDAFKDDLCSIIMKPVQADVDRIPAGTPPNTRKLIIKKQCRKVRQQFRRHFTAARAVHSEEDYLTVAASTCPRSGCD